MFVFTFFSQARRDREEQEKMKAQESMKSAQQQQHSKPQDHSLVSSQNAGHLHHPGLQNDLKLGLGMGVGVGSNLGMMGSLDKSNHDLLKAVSKVNT